MLIAIIIILIVLWFFGYAPISSANIPDIILFSINNHPVTLWDLLILMAIAWAISILPSQLRMIASVLLILWVLSLLGIIAIAGLSNMLVLVIIIGLIVALFI